MTESLPPAKRQRCEATSPVQDQEESVAQRQKRGSAMLRGVLVMAPMVRASTLPLRLLALRHGADFVYTEEIIDRKLARCERRVNDILGTIDFVLPDMPAVPVLRIDPKEERGRLCLQIGTACPETALAAARVACADVATVDVNMGCPEKFSTAGGMGSALLKKPEVAESIVRKLAENLPVPVTCKIRLLETEEDTISFVRRMEAAGAAAIAVHARYVGDRPRRTPARYESLRPIVEAVTVPVIANGDVFSREDAERIKEQTGCASAMSARGAQKNPSLFSVDGQKPLYTLLGEYLDIADKYNQSPKNTKWNVLEMLKENGYTKGLFQQASRAKTREDLRVVVDLFREEQVSQKDSRC